MLKRFLENILVKVDAKSKILTFTKEKKMSTELTLLSVEQTQETDFRAQPT